MKVPRLTITTKRLMIFVAACSILFAACIHPEGDRPGFHLGVWGIRAGVCRNYKLGRHVGELGEPRGWPHDAGIWSERSADLLYGVRVRDGLVHLVMGDWRRVL